MDKVTNPAGCPVTECMAVIGGKWKPVILYCVGNGANRFGILLGSAIAGILGYGILRYTVRKEKMTA